MLNSKWNVFFLNKRHEKEKESSIVVTPQSFCYPPRIFDCIKKYIDLKNFFYYCLTYPNPNREDTADEIYTSYKKLWYL